MAFLFGTHIAVTSGQTLTILPQFFVFAPDFSDDFPSPPSTFNGTAFLANSFYYRLSSIELVPEPATALLGSLGALGLLKRTR